MLSGAAFPSLSSLPLGLTEQTRTICIASEDIAGPTRNGGIGSAWVELAHLLVNDGHRVTLLYLRGQDVEHGAVEDWVEHFRKSGIRFRAAPDCARRDRIGFGAAPAVRRSYNLLCHLLTQTYDLVHVSEWRGAAYLSLLAKTRGIAFQDTRFVIKASSPRAWTLESIGQTPNADDSPLLEAERRSIELADLVVGGSAYLLRWMTSNAYTLPTLSCVQPNVVRPSAMPCHTAGSTVRVNELVFFGRLEPRKGLKIFCDAVERLVTAGCAPVSVTFLGKEGMAIAPSKPSLEWLAERVRDWPLDISIQTDLSRTEALQRLRAPNCLAVMPSLAENSSIAVYEALLYGIPFVATDVGGTSELVAPQDRGLILCEPTVKGLSALLGRCLTAGALVARLAFDNDENLAVWSRFHRCLPWSAGEPKTASRHIAPVDAVWRRAETITTNVLQIQSAQPSIVSEETIAAESTPRILYARRGEVHGRTDIASTIHIRADGRAREAEGQSIDWVIPQAPTSMGFTVIVPRTTRGPVELFVDDAAKPFHILNPIGLAHTSFARSGYQAFSEETRNGRIEGWIWKPSVPTERVEIDIFVNDRFDTRTLADLYRGDLERCRVGSGDHAFNVATHRRLMEGDTIDIVVSGCGLPLPRMPMRMQGGYLRYRPSRLRRLFRRT